MTRVHILGASGAGATTLGRALAARLGVPYHDSDDFLWLPVDPPYSIRRPAAERTALLRECLPEDGAWVFSGSVLGWDAGIEQRFRHLVFLRLDPALRMARLRARELARFGARVQPGGDMAEGSREFLDWAAEYDSGTPEGRSLAAHEAWLARQPAPLLRLDSARPTEELLAAVLAWLAARD